jgi:long-chain acyl-CoA synthetase
VHYLCEDSRSVLFVEDDEQLDKALEVRERCLLRKIVVFDMKACAIWTTRRHQPGRPARAGRERLAGADELMQRGLPPEDLAILVYTSGTTGKPKGAMHRHGLVYTVRGYNTLIARDEHDERMCFLPLCHIAERMGGEYFSLHRHPAQLRREPRDRARERARDRAHGVHRRAARVGEVLFRRDDRAEGIQRCSRPPTPGPSAARASPTACWPASRSARAEARFGWRAGWRWTTCAS